MDQIMVWRAQILDMAPHIRDARVYTYVASFLYKGSFSRTLFKNLNLPTEILKATE